MISRQAESNLRLLANQFRSVAVIGPRQSGKTTLVRHVFNGKPYVSLENPDIRSYAMDDPRGFLSQYPDGAILDEVQKTPDLFSYLQQRLDESDTTGLFILTGSNHFLLDERISQSLSGRVGYLYLLPLTMREAGITSERSMNELMMKGFYPELWNPSQPMNSPMYFANYVRTYVERDVRQVKNITDLYLFDRFLKLCAGRVGQLLNLSNLANEIGVDVKTIGSWIGLLEAAFIAFRLYPHHRNFNKRLTKTPKLYFHDVGLASYLLGIRDATQLDTHPLRGSLFENLIISDILKTRYNQANTDPLHFWRDHVGHEVDLILESGMELHPVEIKSGATIGDSMFDGLRYWKSLSGNPNGTLIYAGDMAQMRSEGIRVVPYREMDF
jgi:predicted AAA+ superfamily ATPase